MNYLKTYKKVEEDFAKYMAGKITFASKEEDMKEHWDFKVGFKVDVKALKKVLRSDKEPNENFHWVELKNVRGDIGWLYGGADYFSFETYDYYAFVRKETLQELIAEKCKAKELCETPELYKIYRRNGKRDLITIVKTLDLFYIAESIYKKDLDKSNDQ